MNEMNKHIPIEHRNLKFKIKAETKAANVITRSQSFVSLSTVRMCGGGGVEDGVGCNEHRPYK